MIKYSHVRLAIFCNAESVDHITRQLGVKPSHTKKIERDALPAIELSHAWCLDSPLGVEGELTARLRALVDAIEPFADKLVSLDARFTRAIDILYHVTPQHVGGITGEFNGFLCPAELMSRISGWKLGLGYETIWFDHPQWQRRRLPWWRRMG